MTDYVIHVQGIEHASTNEVVGVNNATMKTPDDEKIIEYVPRHEDAKGKAIRQKFTYYGKSSDEELAFGRFNSPAANRALVKFFDCACQGAEYNDRWGFRDADKLLAIELAKILDPNLAGPWNETLLHIAAKHGQREVMDILLKRGADARAKTSAWGRTAEDYYKGYEKRIECDNAERKKNQKRAAKDKASKEAAAKALRGSAHIYSK